MANENREIGEIVKKCKILLLDIEGTTTSISFVKDKLFPYAEENVKGFLERQWEADDTKEAVAALRKLALEDQEKSVEGAVVIPGEDASKEDQIEGLVNSVKWQMSSDRKAGPLKDLQGLIWKQGYDNGDIKGHVYDDVSAALEQWQSVEGQKVYIYSSGSVQAQKLLFGQSLAGDLLKFIDGHFDTAVGNKQESSSYTTIVEQIGVKPEDVLFLTDIVKEAEAARSAGLHVALMSREGNAPLSSEAVEAFAVLHSLAQLTVTNKRKNEPQDEQPAKVPKTDTDDDVKSTSESVISEETVNVKEGEEQEKMEVEETPAVQEAKDQEETLEEKKVNVETVIEDITDSVEPLDVPMVDVEPVIIEEGEKSSTENKTEIVDTEPKETVKADETKTDEVIPNIKEPVTKCDEVVEKPDEAVTKSDDAVTKSDEGEAKPDKNGLTESNEDVKFSEVPPSTEAEGVEDSKPVGNDESKLNEVTPATEPEKEKIEAQVVKEKIDVAEETPPTIVTEIEEITVENLGDVEEMIEDLEPVIEEPANEEMEDLKNVGEVLEKECDEILSKVQDVTNLDSIPLKPLLNTIAEESMETDLDAENMDSNDIVDRILDSELELEKQCNDDIDLNSVTDITDDVKTDQEIKSNNENRSEIATGTKPENNTEKEEVSSAPETMATDSSQEDIKNEDKIEDDKKTENNEKVEIDQENENKKECDGKVNDKEESKEENDVKEKLNEQKNNENIDKIDSKDTTEKMETVEDADKVETNNKVEKKEMTEVEESKDVSVEATVEAISQQPTEVGSINEDVKNDIEKDKEACQVNGKATNGDAEIVNLNGDASNVEELNSRLSVENGKEAVNGSNGDSVVTEEGQGDKMEAEVADIKVKTVATEEPRTDPIEQPSEA